MSINRRGIFFYNSNFQLKANNLLKYIKKAVQVLHFYCSCFLAHDRHYIFKDLNVNKSCGYDDIGAE